MAIKKEKIELPLVPLTNQILFPHNVISLFLTNRFYLNSIDIAMQSGRTIFVVPKKSDERKQLPDGNQQIIEELYKFGTVAKILQILKMPDDSVRILIEGITRGKISKISINDKVSFATFNPLTENETVDNDSILLMKIVQESFDEYAKIQQNIPKELQESIIKAEFPDKLVDLAIGNTKISLEQKLEIFENENSRSRLELAAQFLQTEIELSTIQKQIRLKVKEKLEKKQKEYFLTEQIKEINRELGKVPDEIDEIEGLRKKLELKELPHEVYVKTDKEINRLASLQAMSPESGILRFYIDWILDLPWKEESEDNKEIEIARKILNEDHFDLEKPKERILDFIAITQLNSKIKGPILCFIGPPGTGKTSLGKSVANALNREFIRISLGGVRDEAEIRGHRKTYIGALPGKIIQSMKKAGTINPVFLLDEIDKINSDFRGDPASALLEVLDPEQNSTFTDHYLEVPYDLSKVMFIATANSVHKIPHALRDRMEIIEIPGYTDLEKIQIAEKFIVPKQLKENGLDWTEIRFDKKALAKIINEYTMESGVRNLEKNIASIIRKIARKAIEKGLIKISSETSNNVSFKETINEKKIHQLLGKKKFNRDLLFSIPRSGNINGLAWTEYGGTLLPVEATLFEGKGDLILTGNLGDVMKESARIAISFVKANRDQFDLKKGFADELDIHIHVPEGAIPKDGPSAGITLASAIYSAFSEKIPNPHFAMTGEITLTGTVLPIGGLKEKTLAAYRNGIKQIILPESNRNDMEDIPKEVQNAIRFHFVKTAAEVFQLLFDPQPQTKEGDLKL